jgi:hypothetical protein
MAKGEANEPVTKKTLDEAVDTILQGVEGLFKELNKRFDDLEFEQREIKRQIGDLKYDMPTRKEFNELKDRVDKYHPLS